MIDKDDKPEGAKDGKLSLLRQRRFKLLLLVGALCLGAIVLVGCASLSAALPRPEVSSLGATGTTAKYSSGDEVAFEMTWSEESRCAACHAEQVDSTTNECLAAKHADQSCLDCHSDSVALESAHNDLVKALRSPSPEGLVNTEITSDFCTACHDMSAVTPTTVGILTDSTGAAFNPHNIPSNSEHDTIVCSDCHSMHMPEETLATATETCSDCHHEGGYVSCYTCHDELPS